MAAEVDTEALARLHLAQLNEASTTGKITLPNGKVVVPTDDAWDSLINLAKWGVQFLKAKKPKFISSTGELGLKSTRKTSDGKA